MYGLSVCSVNKLKNDITNQQHVKISIPVNRFVNLVIDVWYGFYKTRLFAFYTLKKSVNSFDTFLSLQNAIRFNPLNMTNVWTRHTQCNVNLNRRNQFSTCSVHILSDKTNISRMFIGENGELRVISFYMYEEKYYWQ